MLQRETIIINTIVFKDLLDKGVKQFDILERVHEMGLKKVEIRREFLDDVLSELKAIKQVAEKRDLELYYSINEDLFVDGQVNENLNQFLSELEILDAPFVKMNTGSCEGIEASTWKQLKEITAQSRPIRVENNQHPQYAQLENCLKIMQEIVEHDIPISFVFDTANWVFVGDKVDDAVDAMSAYTSYLHCKNYTYQDEVLKLTTLFKGEIDIQELRKKFVDTVDFALEYPCTEEDLQSDIKQLLS